MMIKTSHPQLVNPDASPEARKSPDLFYSLKGKSTLSGVHKYANHLIVYSDSFRFITGHLPIPRVY